MTPTHRLNPAELEAVPVDPVMCRAMVDQARNHHQFAGAATTIPDLVGGFQIAYDGCRKVALALVLASGARPRSTAHHQITFDAAAALVARHCTGPVSTTLRRSLDDATDLRRLRAGSEYRGETIADRDLQDATEILAELLDGLPPLIEGLLPPAP